MKYFDRNTWFWAFCSALFFLPFLGGVHLFDWDEINFAELAREMLVTGNGLQLQINYESFTEKPPLFFWLQALSMTIFGVGEYAARFPNALLGIVVLPFLYISGKFLIDRKFGFLWAMSWFGSILPFLYFKSGIIDPWFNFFIFNGLFFLIHYKWRKDNYNGAYFSRSAKAYLWLGGISIGLGILTKGPVAYLIVFLCLVVYWFKERLRTYLSFKGFFSFSFIALLTFSLWFLIDLIINGPDFIVEFTIRQWELLTTSDAGHQGFPAYHFVVLLLGCFPASIFAIRAMKKIPGLPYHLQDFKLWMVILLWVVLILFSLVGTKIIHYSSLAYYPLSFLAALWLWHTLENGKAVAKWMNISLVTIGLIIILVSAALPWAGMHIETIRPLFKADPFAMANLNARVPWSIWNYLPAVFYLLILTAYLILLARKQTYHAFRTLFLGTSVWVMLALVFFIGKIERISQRASVEFFKEAVDREVYVTTFGYKSYVPWFYGKVMPYNNMQATNKDWLLYGQTDRPVLISCKITHRERLESKIPDAVFLYEKNGFCFYQRF